MSSTVFVRNLAFASTSAELEELFSEIGPLKHAFVVTEAGVKADAAAAGSAATPGRSRGFGFVEFRVPEDAARAIVEYQVRAPYSKYAMWVFVSKEIQAQIVLLFVEFSLVPDLLSLIFRACILSSLESSLLAVFGPRILLHDLYRRAICTGVQ